MIDAATCRTCAHWSWPTDKRDYALDAPCLEHQTLTAATDWCDEHDALKVTEADDV